MIYAMHAVPYSLQYAHSVSHTVFALESIILKTIQIVN